MVQVVQYAIRHTPTTKLVFLGIEINTVTKMLRLPEEKWARLQATIGEWQNKRSCTKRDLLSLIGQLHACCVVRPGRTFLRRMINLVAVARKLHYKIRLNAVFRADLRWWATFLSRWNDSGVYPDGRGGCYVRRIWLVGLWSVRVNGGVVSTAVAKSMGQHPHHNKRAPTR